MICAVVVRKSASQGRAMKFEDGVACVMRAVYQARNIGLLQGNFVWSTVNDIAEQFARAARERPAQRSMTGVQKQIVVFGFAYIGNIVRRGGAQPGPELRFAAITDVGK